MNSTLTRVAITQGDTNGIGYELIFKAFAEPEILEIFTPVIYGTRKIADVHAEMLGVDFRFNTIKTAADMQENRINFVEVSEESAPVKMGTQTIESESMASKALHRALQEYSEGLFDVLVTAPSNIDQLHDIVELLVSFSGIEAKDMQPATVTGNSSVILASVTGNVTREKALSFITEHEIEEHATMLNGMLKRDFCIDIPRIAVMSFDEKTDLSEGSKDSTTTLPAIENLRKNKIQVFGPYSAKELFEDNYVENFDCVLGIYDEQVTVPYAANYTNTNVLFTAGLPIVVCAPAEGASFETAGQGTAAPSSMLQAIFTAIDVYRNRKFYDEANANPLPKLYHERREDGDKARFAAKKGFDPKEARAEREARIAQELKRADN